MLKIKVVKIINNDKTRKDKYREFLSKKDKLIFK